MPTDREETKPIDVEGTRAPLEDPPERGDDESPWPAGLQPQRLEDVTLRDAFAALAMVSMDNTRGMAAEALAHRCYEIADHMLLQRLK